MEEKVERYLREEKGITDGIVREMLKRKVLKYQDIAGEFERWLELREYDEEGLKIQGYGAVEIYEMAPWLDGIGVFNLLVALRDEPEETKKTITEGLAIK